jgi:hypothetical protein
LYRGFNPYSKIVKEAKSKGLLLLAYSRTIAEANPIYKPCSKEFFTKNKQTANTYQNPLRESVTKPSFFVVNCL